MKQQQLADSVVNFDIADEAFVMANTRDEKNLLRDFFLRIKQEIQKLLNDQQISVQIFEIIPVEIESDFQELVNSIKMRLNADVLSFISIKQLESDYFDPHREFNDLFVQDQEAKNLMLKIFEQERMIADLTMEREIHEKTITMLGQEKEELEEENEARFIAQLCLLKKELKQLKDKNDSLELLLATTKKSMFRIVEIVLSDEKDLEQDLQQAVNHYKSVVRLTQKENQKLSLYVSKYVLKSKTKRSSWFG